ncbi:hypothetical protein T10_1982 [Trichinella papuae]|uniref:Uncharacterized protein n=1 Tax=Trichinella papuae TaxID=268474 RepID=A0A0V1MQ16_9BILA|nr:hypothetical protein T10_1982 [Trichinella papuae]
MSQSYFRTFDSWAFSWQSTQTLWFILVQEDRFPHLRFRAVRNEMGEWKFQSVTTIENKSRVMGKASHEACFNITDVISAPSMKCVAAADSFIKAFERDQKDEMKILNIKVDGGLSESVEGYYLQKQFRSLAVERGYPVDEVYETSIKWSENCNVDAYVNLDWRINAALESLREKYSGSMDKVVVVFVDKSLESVLRGVGIRSRVLFKLHAPPENVWYVHKLGLNLFSIGKAAEKGLNFTASADGSTFRKNGCVKLSGVRNLNGVYELHMRVFIPEKPAYVHVSTADASLQLWHERLCHQNKQHRNDDVALCLETFLNESSAAGNTVGAS